MATNKHATIRYHALDKCFNNRGRKFFISDLIEACNKAIYEYSGVKDGVKKRQVFADISFMESEEGWCIPLERLKEGRKVYYRYSDETFSISNKGINPSEANQIKETLSILSRFKGIPQFEWIEEIKIRMEEIFGFKGNITPVVAFEENPYLKGLNNFTELFNAINNKQALIIKYQGFKQKKDNEFIFHPWFLKKYNNRWFLFGYNEDYKGMSNLAIDRILSISDTQKKYIENKDIDFDDFFEDIVGVSKNLEVGTEKVVVKIENKIWPYIKSKPIHGSQKIKKETEDSVIIELDVQVNHELIALLFSHMDGIEILEPLSLRSKFKAISNAIFEKYK